MELTIRIVSTHLGHVRGGAEINDLNLGGELTDLGHDVSYLAIAGGSMEFDEWVDIRTVDCPYIYDLSYSLPKPLGNVTRHINEELFVHRIRREAKELLSEADIVYGTGRPVLCRLQSHTPAPYVQTVRGRVNPLYDRYLRRADGVIFWGGCEEAYEDDTIFSVPNRQIDPGVDSDLFRPLELTDTIRPEYAFGNRTTLVFSGRLEPVKRIDNIIEAVSRVESEFDLTLVIIGDGSRRNSLEELAESVIDETPTHFLGRVEHDLIPIHLNTSDLFVLASQLENHPIALKEALACGTYSLAPSIGRIPTILDEGTGYVFGENTTTGLATALRTVLSEGRHQRGTRTERAVHFTDWGDAASELVEFFELLR